MILMSMKIRWWTSSSACPGYGFGVYALVRITSSRTRFVALPQDTTYLIQRPVTNEEISAKIQQAIGPHEDLPTVDANWSGIDMSPVQSGLAKTILQGTVKAGRRQGRQKKRWEDNIKEWTGLGFAKSQRAVENRGEWRKLVVKPTVVPQRPPRFKG